jgi:hypothetical protein
LLTSFSLTLVLCRRGRAGSKACPSDFTLAHDLDLVDLGRVHGQDAFDTDAIGQAANRHGFGQASAFLGNDGAFEDLDTFAFAFFDLQVNFDVVTNFDLGQIRTELFVFNYGKPDSYCVPPLLPGCSCTQLSSGPSVITVEIYTSGFGSWQVNSINS